MSMVRNRMDAICTDVSFEFTRAINCVMLARTEMGIGKTLDHERLVRLGRKFVFRLG